MAKINTGILGGFIGKVGTVIGYIVDGKAIIHALPPVVRREPTEKQAKQRNKFTMLSEFLLPMQGYIKVGWANHCKGMTEMNAATSYHLKNAFVEEQDETKFDYRKALVARGVLPHRVYDIGLSVTDLVAIIAWEDNSALAEAYENDVAMPLAYNTDKCQAVFDLNGGSRVTGSTRLKMPQSWAGDSVVFYLAFRSEDYARVGDSIYLGRFTAQ